MSILNLGTARRYVLVGTDTEARAFDGSRAQLPKMHVISHLGALIACRGAYQMFTILAQQCNFAQTLDDLMNSMEGLIEHSIKLAEPSYLATGAPEAQLRHNTVALVGVGSEGVVARLWNAYDDPAYRVWDVPQGYSYIAPDFGIARMSCQTQDEQERVARRQYAHFKRHVESADNPQLGCGGSLIVTRVDEAGIRIEKRCNLDELARPQSLFTAGSAVF